MTRFDPITSDVHATREQELAVLVERILAGDFSGLPSVEAQWYLPTDWIDAAQAYADVAGEPQDAAQALAELETMLFREVAYDGWLALSDGAQADYADDPHVYFDARREARAFRGFEANNYRIAQFCSDILGGARV